MLRKVLIALVVLGSIAWIGYYLLDIVDRNNSFKVEELFGKQDESVLIINRPADIEIKSIYEFSAVPSVGIVAELNDTLIDRLFVSKKRDHVFIYRERGWDINMVKALFKKSKVLPENNKEFSVGKYKGRYQRSGLYIFNGTLEYGDSFGKPFDYDQKSSASVLSFTKDSYEVTDIYLKDGGRFDYVQQSSKVEQGNQIDDVSKFSGFISSSISSYHFYERDFYAMQDEVYREGPMKSWNEQGFVVVEIDGKQAIVSDYLPGQDPILVLNDAEQNLGTAGYTVPILKGFPEGKTYYINYIEDVVVISESQQICDKLTGDYKLGKVLSSDASWMSKLVEVLPKYVSERKVSDIEVFSKSVYKKRLLVSRVQKEFSVQKKVHIESISMAVDGNVISFSALSKGNVVSISSNGKLQYFKNQKELWKKDISGVNSLEVIELYDDRRPYILASSKDQIHLYDENGNLLDGFPVSLDSDRTSPVEFYRWKQGSYLLVATEKGLQLYDSKGVNKKNYTLPFIATRRPDVWVSQSKLFFGASDGNNFAMLNSDQDVVYRKFETGQGAVPIEVPNQIFQYTFDKKTLIKTDQKGIVTRFGEFENGKILGVRSSGNPTLVIQSINKLIFANTNAIPFATIELPFTEVQSVELITLSNGKTAVAVIDGLQNNVYLYTLDGSRLLEKDLEGQTQVALSKSGEQLIITTIVDQFIVQYVEN